MPFRFKFPTFGSIVFMLMFCAFVAVFGLSGPRPYSERRPDDFVLSEEMPISIGHGILGNLSASTEPVDILVERQAHFRIPRNYLYTISPDRRERSVSIQLVTLFPAFEGVTVDGDNGRTIREGDKNLSWKNMPNIVWIYSTTQIFDPEHDPNTIVFSAEENQPNTQGQYGLLKSLKKSDIGQNVYFLRPVQNKEGYVVFCPTDSSIARVAQPDCHVYFRISPRIVIQYQFHRDLLPHWQAIHEKITSLIQSFIVQDGK